MKVLPFKIPKTDQESIRVQIDRGAYFYDTLHNHPEIQLTHIVEGSGNVLIGDYFGSFKPGDVFLIGSNMAHIFRSDEIYYQEPSIKEVESVSIFFDKNCLGKEFLILPESKKLIEWFSRPNRSFKFNESNSKKLEHLINEIKPLKDFERLVKFIEILQVIISPMEPEVLSYGVSTIDFNEHEGKKLDEVFKFTFKNFKRKITIDEVAEITFMSPSAFCRYFKSRTNKTFITFLNEVRIAHACTLLTTSELTTMEICYESGFNNLSNFNKIFKTVKGETPTNFKRLIRYS